MTKYTIIPILVFFSINVFSQNISENTQLAMQYYQSKEFDKAEILFEEIYKATNTKFYFTYYVNSLIEQAKYDQAEKQLKKEIKKSKQNFIYKVDLGYLYKKQGQTEKAEKEYNEAIKSISINENEIKSLANTFVQRLEYEYAEKTYAEGKQKTGNNFNSELANVYAVQRKYKEMINKYLDYLEEDPKNTENTQNNLNYFITNDINNEFYELLKTELLKRIQKNDSKIVHSQMLVWLFITKNEFSKALIQEIAIDKRLNTSGKKIMELAQASFENKNYETALKAYNYIIEKGRNTPYYIEAQTSKLDVLYSQTVESDAILSPEKIAELELEYETTIKSLGLSENTIQSTVKLARLKAFYLNKPDEAIQLLNKSLSLKGLKPNLVALCKIELADILLYQNDIWQAALLYGQAEKDNENLPVGDIAKLKKAKLAYYAQNFQWAKAQFDALKPSTSKLIANDAIFYSVLIEENTKPDTSNYELKKYADAEFKIFMNKPQKANQILDSLINFPVGGNLTDEAYLLKAQIYENEKNYNEAVKYYQKIITEYYYDIWADLAVYKLALLYENKLGDKQNAAEYYKKLMTEFPESIYVAEARRLFRKIRENQ